MSAQPTMTAFTLGIARGGARHKCALSRLLSGKFFVTFNKGSRLFMLILLEVRSNSGIVKHGRFQ